MMSFRWIASLLVFLVFVCCFYKPLREGFQRTMNLTLSQMVSQRSLQIDPQTLPYQAICAKTTGRSQCKPPYECKSASDLQYGNCL